MSEQQAVIASCSFCLKPNTSVKRLVAGPGVFICNECVELCNLLVAGDGSPVPGLAPWEHAASTEEVLAHLPLVAAAGAQVDRNLAGWVGRARSLGVTWARIGEALGMTRQSAWERFSGEE
ncbi:MAG TPA: ClpX C4-type zinc finger protein [Streptosporangiaceae bacterium]|jgi:hypothetical protein